MYRVKLVEMVCAFGGEAHFDFLPDLADALTGEAERFKELDGRRVFQRDLACQPVQWYWKAAVS